MFRTAALLAIMALVTVVHAQPVERIETLRDMCIETPLAVDGKSAALIVHPQQHEALAKTVQETIQRVTGLALPLRLDTELTEADLEQQHCIALGNCNDNALLGRLYAMRMDFTDSIYPGVAKPNSGFDVDDNHDDIPDNWSITLHDETTHSRAYDAEVSRSAPRSVRLEGTTAQGAARAALHRSVPLEPGRYELSIWYRSQPAEGGYASILVYYVAAEGGMHKTPGVSLKLEPAEDWASGSVSFEVPADAPSTSVLFYQHGPGKVWYDDVALIREGSDENLLGAAHRGAIVRTVHNPFGYGRNVVVLGASDEEGLRRSVELLGQQVSGPVLPRLLTIEIGDTARASGIVPGPGPDEAARAKMAEAAAGQIATNAFVTVRGVMNGTRSYAQNYFLTGSENWALLYRDIWRAIMAEPDEKNNAHGPMEWTFQAMEGWDLVEEAAALTDQDRLDITNHLLKVGVRNEQSYGRNIQNVNRTIADGHQLDQALCIYMHGYYFDKYYGINGHWKDMALPLIKLAENTPRVHDSYAYGPIIATDFITGEYSLKTGDMTFFENGNCLEQARWMMLCSDNLGAGGTFGDDGAWRGSIRMDLMARANWFYRDDTLKWFMQGYRPLIGGFANDRPARKPVELMGTKLIPLHPNLYKVAAETRRDAGAASWSADLCPPEKAFDKLSFRSDFGEQYQYMLIDGITEISHGHRDGASILRFTDNDRLFLTEGHYIQTSPREHNTLLVSHDGQQWSPPPLVSLEHHADLERTGMAQVLTSAYNGADWRRSIVWLKEGFFVVVDDVEAREAGEFDLECNWRSLGRAALGEGGLFTVDQTGEGFAIQDAGGSGAVIQEQWDGQSANYYASYPYSPDGLVKVLRQHRSLTMQPGERMAFCNLLHTYQGSEPTLRAERVTDRAMLVSGPQGRWLVGVGEVDLPGIIATDAAMWMVGSDGLVAYADATRLSVGGAVQALAGPSGEVMLPGSGAALNGVKAAPAGTVAASVDDEPELEPLWQLELDAEARPLSNTVSIGVSSDIAPLPASTWDASYKINLRTIAQQWGAIVLWDEDQAPTITLDLGRTRDISKVGLRTMWTNNSGKGIRYRLAKAVFTASAGPGGPYTEVAAFEETGDHPIPSHPEYIQETPGLSARYIRVTATPQAGACLFLEGIRVWGLADATGEHDPRYRAFGTSVISALAAADIDGQAGDELLLGTEGGGLALVREGTEVWRVETGARVNCIAVGNITGDERPEILAGTDSQQLQCYDTDGKLVWKKEFPFFWNRDGNVVWVEVADLDGDGDNEVAMAAENWHYYALDGEGNELWKFNVPHSPVEGAVGDVNGDGKLEIVASDEYYSGRVLEADGKQLFPIRITQPYMTAALAPDLDGDGKCEAVIGGQDMQAHVYGGDGKVLFDANVGSVVTDLQALPAGTGHRLIVASDGMARNLSCYDATGTALWRLTLPGAPRQIAVCGDTIAAGCNDGALRLFDPGGAARGILRLSAPVDVVISARTAGGEPIAVCASGNLLSVVAAGAR